MANLVILRLVDQTHSVHGNIFCWGIVADWLGCLAHNAESMGLKLIP